MFWGRGSEHQGINVICVPLGLKLESGKNYTQIVEDSFHISQATLEPNGGSFAGGMVAVHAIVDETDYILCYLGHGDLESPIIQRSLNLEFIEGEKITLYTDFVQKQKGSQSSCTVHLTGYCHDLLPEECNILPFGRFMDESSSEDNCCDDDCCNGEFEDEEIELDSDMEDIRNCPPTTEELSDEGETAERSAVTKRERSKDLEADDTLQPSAPKKKKKKKKDTTSTSNENSLKEKVKPASETKKASNMFKTDGGTEVQEIVIGSGKLAKPGKKVFVKYTGRLAHNNRIFDSNISGKRDFMFRLGQGEVVKGWDHGIKGMKVGGKRRLVLPPSQGYGSKGAPPDIPPNSKLIFDIELTNVK